MARITWLSCDASSSPDPNIGQGERAGDSFVLASFAYVLSFNIGEGKGGRWLFSGVWFWARCYERMNDDEFHVLQVL